MMRFGARQAPCATFTRQKSIRAKKPKAMSAHFSSIASAFRHAAYRPAAVVLASTSTNIRLTRELVSNGEIDAVVGGSEKGAATPLALLDALDSSNPPRRTAIFTDQLYCTTNAPVLTSKGIHQRYLSSLEIILHGMHAFSLFIQTKSGLIEIPPEASAEDILTALWTHIDLCTSLGDEWIASAHQHQRDPEWRSQKAHYQLRLFHSSLLHMGITHGNLDQTRLTELHHQLMEARIRCR